MSTIAEEKKEMRISKIAETIIGSEIIKIAAEVNEKIKSGARIYNLTIGDFNPQIFPIPSELKQEILKAYESGHTNYPSAEGMPELRQAVSALLKRKFDLDYKPEQIIIAGGARPVIYGVYKAIVDPGDTVVFPVPSWNNNHYAHLMEAEQLVIETRPENNFMPTADELKPCLGKASLVALCSPLNPTGTVFSKNNLEEICDLILEENTKRDNGQKPLYLLYDQIYSELTFGGIRHYNPVSLRPEMKPYTVFVDGISKSLAATGVRVGWAFGPQNIIDKMKSILSHVGAWAPKAEQVATANFLAMEKKYDSYLEGNKKMINDRLLGFYEGIQSLKKDGFNVDAVAPQAAIYLTVQFNLKGKKTSGGKTLAATPDITRYLLEEAGIAIVPFYAFGAPEESAWYRLSVGTCRMEDVREALDRLKNALKKLS